MFRIGLEGDLCRAPSASDVEAVYLDGVVGFVGSLFSRVEFAATVYELATGGAFHGEGSHQTNGLDLGAGILGLLGAGDLAWVEVRGIVL